MKTFDTNSENICLCCGSPLDAADHLREGPPPTEGDLNICAYCGNLTKYDEELRIVAITVEELEQIFEEEPSLKEQIIQIKTLLGHKLFNARAILN